MKPIEKGRYRFRNGRISRVNVIDTATEPAAHEDLPPALNFAVKAAEDRVRELKQLVDETQTAWATACRLHEAAQRDLERLEKECEVGK